jgi:hypothetical protein
MNGFNFYYVSEEVETTLEEDPSDSSSALISERDDSDITYTATLMMEGMECDVEDTWISSYETLQECIDACAKTEGC